MMMMPIPEEVLAAEQKVLDAAGWTVNSYRARGGYSVPLSINLQTLAVAVDAWRAAMHAHALDSDVNGFDRSAVEEKGGNSYEQSSSEAPTQRRGCAKASPAPDSSSTKTKRKRTVRPGAA